MSRGRSWANSRGRVMAAPGSRAAGRCLLKPGGGPETAFLLPPPKLIGDAMKIKSALVTQISGSIGGVTGSHNRSGMYLRSRAIPTNPNTALQAAVRQNLGQLSAMWQTLTSTQQAGWNEYAANVAMTNPLGDTVYLTGQQHFIRSNSPRLQFQQNILSAAPTVFNLGTFTAPTITSAVSGAQQVEMGFQATDEWAGEDDSVMAFYLGMSVSPGRNFYKGPFRYAGNQIGDSGVPPVSPFTITVPPYALSTGSKIWVLARVARGDGRLSMPTIVGPYTVTAS